MNVRSASSRLIVFFVCSLLLVQNAFCADSTAYALHTYVYKKVGANELKLDVFSPLAAGKPCPAIILFHGGSWVSGQREQLYWQCKYFVQQGMVAITADYRLISQDTTRKDICIMDAKSAIRWVKSHAALLNIDSGKVITGGASAGGHLATMTVLNPGLHDASDDTTVSTSARALVLFNPAYSLQENPAVEPFNFVSTHLPPVIMFFGSRDKWKPPADSLYTLLKKAGVPCERWIANGETHGFFNKSPWNLATCIKAQDFLVQHGLIKNVSSLPAPAGLQQAF